MKYRSGLLYHIHSLLLTAMCLCVIELALSWSLNGGLVQPPRLPACLAGLLHTHVRSIHAVHADFTHPTSPHLTSFDSRGKLARAP